MILSPSSLSFRFKVPVIAGASVFQHIALAQLINGFLHLRPAVLCTECRHNLRNEQRMVRLNVSKFLVTYNPVDCIICVLLFHQLITKSFDVAFRVQCNLSICHRWHPAVQFPLLMRPNYENVQSPSSSPRCPNRDWSATVQCPVLPARHVHSIQTILGCTSV